MGSPALQSAPRERPILFSAPMVRALLAGTKTQTRRIPTIRDRDIMCPDCEKPGDRSKAWGEQRSLIGPCLKVPCECGSYQRMGPPWSVGDLLWVKEALSRDADGLVRYATGGELVEGREIEWDWKPKRLGAMYCPRWASRITLEVVEVRVQRLTEITEEDALAEGIAAPRVVGPELPLAYRDYADPERDLQEARASFASLWDSINSKRPGCAWADSPWVFAISFRRVTP